MDKKMIYGRVAALRERMAKEGIDAVVMTSTDDHASEYVHDHYKVTEFFSGCTSDNVTLVIYPETAHLWTDGRYFISAAGELEGTGIELMKMGEKGVPTAHEHLKNNFPAGGVLAMDRTCITHKDACGLTCGLDAVVMDIDPAEGIWTDRPARPKSRPFILDETVTGEGAASKLSRIRQKMKAASARFHFVSDLAEIAWTLNIRGDDVFCSPLVLSFLLIGNESCSLFMAEEAVTEELAAYLERIGVEVHPYDEAFSFLKENTAGYPVLIDGACTADAYFAAVEENGRAVDEESPIELMKAAKNPIEIEHIKDFYLRDSAALCKFLFWLDKNVGEIEIDEISAAEKLDSLRAEVPGFLELSFPTISAYGANAAMAHYAPQPGACASLSKRGFYLVDSGGQYMGATTDVTRTAVCGELTEEEKKAFTLVAAGHFNLMYAKFRKGSTGKVLDAFARGPLWAEGVDYNHGTGHGIGYILNVHEGPQSVRWHSAPYTDGVEFLPGMIVSDEPGLYVEGKYGIRTESILLARDDFENEYGKFMAFDCLTFAPVDRRALDLRYLSDRDVARIDAYHEEVYGKVSPFLTEEERQWLYEMTRPLS